MTRIQRQYKRFRLELGEVQSKICLASKVEIIDISLGGMAIKADRKLNIGRECLLMLRTKERNINIKGVVVRSELSGIEEGNNGESFTMYSTGIMFRDASLGKIADFLNSIDPSKFQELPVMENWRFLNVNFTITTPSEKILHFPSEFSVQHISLHGICIRSEHRLKVDSLILMALSLNASESVNFMGRVASCQFAKDGEQIGYEITAEFSDLTDNDKTSLMTFVAYFADMESHLQAKKAFD